MPDKFDSEKTDRLINFLNGTVDARTKELREHRRDDYITKLVHYNYDPNAKAERWERFLNEIMGCGPSPSDADESVAERAGMVEYLKLALGYSITRGHESRSRVRSLQRLWRQRKNHPAFGGLRSDSRIRHSD